MLLAIADNGGDPVSEGFFYNALNGKVKPGEIELWLKALRKDGMVECQVGISGGRLTGPEVVTWTLTKQGRKKLAV